MAGVCNHLGISMGKSFDSPSKANPKGYFEDLDFKKLHKEMLEGIDVGAAYLELVGRREQEFGLWGVKDPRLCLLLDELTNKLSTEHRLINVIRPTDEITQSLHKQMGDVGDWEKLAEYYLEQKEVQLQHYESQIINIQYHDLLSDTKVVVGRIANFVAGHRPFDSWSSHDKLRTATESIG